MPTLDELKGTLKDLPVGDRLKLADWLYESADDAGSLHPDWYDVAEARLKDLEDGQVKGIPGDEALRLLRESGRQR